MRTDSFLSLSPNMFHRVVFTEWGKPDHQQVLLCVHGLTRNGRDFDYLATALKANYRVICPDVAGRGCSEWLEVKEDYNYPTYCADMATLIARLHAEQVDWVGTSMGGIIGMLLAAQPKAPVRRLVINDIGPFVPRTALERIGQYLGTNPHFDNLTDAASYLRQVHAGFGPLTDDQWVHLARHSVHPATDGQYSLMYDPAIAMPFKSEPMQDIDLWDTWDRIRCPVLVLRGIESDVLLEETAAEMQRRGPPTEVVQFRDIGHAPALMAKDQIDTVCNWLLRQ
ncbi:MAG: alpha/beta fold hydrolase [Acidiferrobacterales bacterium]